MINSLWYSERGVAAPKTWQDVDDSLPAELAYKLASEGVGLMWRGDFNNARQLLAALGRRVDKAEKQWLKKHPLNALTMPERFNRHRQNQAQRANLLNRLVVELQPDWQIPLRRAPDWSLALASVLPLCDQTRVISLRELLGIQGAYEWAKNGVEVPALGQKRRIYPAYGVYSPVRSEYLDLLAQAPLPALPDSSTGLTAFDIGTGTGVIAALLALRGVQHVVATDTEPRALVCAAGNLQQLGIAGQVQLQEHNLFPPDNTQADLLVCNPPWLPAKPASRLESAMYDPGSQMLLGFLKGAKAHLKPGGQVWLVLSDLAQHLGLRPAGFLEQAFEQAGLKVQSRASTRPAHRKTSDKHDILHEARCQEVTTLWVLQAAV
ncbi:MAG: class I SAM-dependent methyltransferase [Limnobacter sp.]|nr:class I SAM-dependent methyltransferase [Limnobacter sp.]